MAYDNTRGSNYGNRQQSRPQQTAQREQSPRNEIPPQAGAGNQAPALWAPHKQKLFEKFGAKYGVDPEVLAQTLKQTCFKKPRNSDVPVSNEQLVALLIVADQYGLNPFTKEIYAYPDKDNGIVPVVSVDGWIRIIQEHPEFDGMTFAHSDAILEDPSTLDAKFKHKPCWDWFEVTIYRKDRAHATPITEYFDEVYRPPLYINKDGGYYIPTPWQSHTKRMMRHKTIIQGGRVVFGFAGIYDDDEAKRIVGDDFDESVVATVPPGQAESHAAQAKNALRPTKPATQPANTAPVNGKQYVGEPWDEPEPPQAQKQKEQPLKRQAVPEPTTPNSPQAWQAALKQCATPAVLDETWDATLAWFDSQGKEIDLDTEATYQMMKDEFAQ